MQGKYSFDEEGIIENAPVTPGVYWLWDGDEVIYIGMSEEDSVQSRLKDHLRGNEGPCTQGADSFSFDTSRIPNVAERIDLLRFQQSFGELPRCNDLIP